MGSQKHPFGLQSGVAGFWRFCAGARGGFYRLGSFRVLRGLQQGFLKEFQFYRGMNQAF